jgi:RNA polymerase sigma factor (sigma-70 family)
MRPSDADLLNAWGDGDPRAGRRLFNRYYVAISRFFVNKVPKDPDDLVQDTFMACLRGRERLRDKGSFRAYLFGVASNVLRMHFRSQRLHPLPEDLEDHSAHDLAPGPTTVIHAQEEERLLLDALRRIPLHLQIVMELYYWEQMTTEEIGEIVDSPTGTVRSHLRRGRQLLEQELELRDPSDRAKARVLVDLEQWASSVRTTITRECA